jgi:hypothetical protein
MKRILFLNTWQSARKTKLIYITCTLKPQNEHDKSRKFAESFSSCQKSLNLVAIWKLKNFCTIGNKVRANEWEREKDKLYPHLSFWYLWWFHLALLKIENFISCSRAFFHILICSSNALNEILMKPRAAARERDERKNEEHRWHKPILLMSHDVFILINVVSFLITHLFMNLSHKFNEFCGDKATRANLRWKLSFFAY